MIDKKLGYDKKTQALIDRMCHYVEREDYVLNKKVAEEKILQTYDMDNFFWRFTHSLKVLCRLAILGC